MYSHQACSATITAQRDDSVVISLWSFSVDVIMIAATPRTSVVAVIVVVILVVAEGVATMHHHFFFTNKIFTIAFDVALRAAVYTVPIIG